MRVVEAFRESYGAEPVGVWHAPGRVNLIGEHTDYNDGFVLPFAVPWGVTAAVSPREDGVVRLRSLQTGAPVTLESPDEAEGWARYAAGVFWVLREAGHRAGGADVVIDGDVPQGAGLSSSAALEVVVGTALNELYGLGLSKMEVALAAQKAENDFVGMPCGIMDQAASALAQEGQALFMDCRSLGTRNIPFDLAQHGLQLLIINTGVHHELADGQYARRRQDCENAAKRLGVDALRDVTDLAGALAKLGGDERKRVQHVVTENHRVEAVIGLLRAGAVREVGALLNASHLSLRDQYEVSCVELDVAVESAVQGGARGARMTGGGFGGSAIALVADDRVESVRESVTGAYAERGWAAPEIYPATPAAGARRLT
ncbi:galactokinase [Streptosporangium becharense]|uniref:Galactokinase n=1 Tax=Streptosporangium becharense TaxID=1816182 RepID=A0A7W9IE68_9ACTN|nr:galactokinase [Streptosporangium becharense]MBB2912099.1 galactokinase [Streptosporangium becharense]MBB5818646.1 galactokinase [Streptosporangium becharense]